MAFGIFQHRKTLRKIGFFKGFTDYHSHILPGVDDGVKTMEESLRILTLYEELGVFEVWCTPHIMEDIANTTHGLQKRFSELLTTYEGTIKLHLAAEYMLDNLFEKRFVAGDLLPLGVDGKYLLVETSYFNPPMGFYDTLEKIKTEGYSPVLAHPERYRYMDEKDYSRLKNMGVMFQLNIPSLLGIYDTIVQKKAEFLFEKSYYEFTGTDIHSFKQILYCIEKKTKIKYFK